MNQRPLYEQHVSGPALAAFLRVSAAWALEEPQERMLLGQPSPDTPEAGQKLVRPVIPPRVCQKPPSRLKVEVAASRSLAEETSLKAWTWPSNISFSRS